MSTSVYISSLIKHIFWRLFFQKLQRSETFGKFQILTSAIVWTTEFPLVFHAANTIKTMCCGVAAIVLSGSAAYLTGYVASTATPKKIKK